MDHKPSLQAKPGRRKVTVVYYLSRGGGQMDHPHLIEGYLLAAQDSLRLRDFKRWLAVVRGKSVSSSYAWSYKRTYKNGFIWHDLGETDLIHPLSKNEYVLMGSEIKEPSTNITKCKCGAIQQQTETKIVAEVGDKIQEAVPLNKQVFRSPMVVTKSSSFEAEENCIERLSTTACSPAKLAVLSLENKFQDSAAARTVSKSNLHQGGASSQSSNNLKAKTSIEEVKKSTIDNQDMKALATLKRVSGMTHGSTARVSGKHCEIIAEGNCIQNGINVVDGCQKGSINGIGHDTEDDMNGTYIMDAATQTGESTACSTEDNQPEIDSTDYLNVLELVENPGCSAKLSSVRRVSSDRFSCIQSHDRMAKGNVPLHFSQEFSTSPNLEKASMTTQYPGEIETQNVCHLPSSNHTSLHNHMGSPGALSSCSAMSAISNVRFDCKGGNHGALSETKKGKRCHPQPDNPKNHRHHHQSKGTSAQNTSSGSATSASHNFLKQLLKCGSADAVLEKKPSNAASNNVAVAVSSDAMSGMQTPSRAAIATAGDKSKWKACKPGGLMKRMSSNASSDNRSVISATASEQCSMRDRTEMASSPESVQTASSRHLKRDMMRAHSLAATSVTAAIRSQKCSLISANGHGACCSAPHRQIRCLQPSSSAAAGSTSPGIASVASSSASQRSSIKETNVTIVGGSNAEEGVFEALDSHQIKTRVRSNPRSYKGNKNNPLINGILDKKEPLYDDKDSSTGALNVDNGLSNHSTIVNELHKLICNPGGTPTCSSHNRAASTNLALSSEGASNEFSKWHALANPKKTYTPPHAKAHFALISSSGLSRTPTRSSKLCSSSVGMLSKSLNSPSSFFMEAHHSIPLSTNGSSWKEHIWSPQYKSLQKEKRHMKP